MFSFSFLYITQKKHVLPVDPSLPIKALLVDLILSLPMWMQEAFVDSVGHDQTAQNMQSYL